MGYIFSYNRSCFLALARKQAEPISLHFAFEIFRGQLVEGLMIAKGLKMQKSDFDKQIEIAIKYVDILNEIGKAHGISPAVLAGIISRESAWGLLLTPRGPHGTGDFKLRKRKSPFRRGNLPDDGGGFGRGLMQIDYDYHEFARSGNWKDPHENINYGCEILAKHRKQIASKIKVDDAALLSASIASYNCGVTNVLKAIRLNLDYDFYTTNRDYSKDVLLRADILCRGLINQAPTES